jgi:hypothetical protein
MTVSGATECGIVEAVTQKEKAEEWCVTANRAKCLQCSDGASNKVSNIIRRHILNRKLLLICILLLADFFIVFRFYFYQYMVVFLFPHL